MIDIEGLSKTYAGTGRPALNNVSLHVPKGAIYGILGRSGAGKSTLIRCLNLLERPTSGRIIINGSDITQLDKAGLREHRLRTGMIFQHFNLLHARTVADNVAVPLEIAGVPKPLRHARVEELLHLVGLSDKADAFPSQLSGGQKQRVPRTGCRKNSVRSRGIAGKRRSTGERQNRRSAGCALVQTAPCAIARSTG